MQEIKTLLSLRGTEHENLNTKLDTILQEIRKTALDSKIISLEDKITQLETALGSLVEAYKALQSENNILAEKIAMLDNITADIGENTNVGTVYTRWGRTSCPGNGSDLVYSGYAAGGHYTHKGASPNMLCLPEVPEWGEYVNGVSGQGGLIYGVEYEQSISDSKALFGDDTLHDQDAPCAVCEVKQRTRKIMISGRTTCYDGWTREYWGYLMTGHYNHNAAHAYHCIDINPESLPGGNANVNGYLLYFVEVNCANLKCPPYVTGREMTCVVCTK